MRRTLYVVMLGILACGCQTGSMAGHDGRLSDPQLVLGRTWLWEATVKPLEKITVPEPARYTFMLASDGRAQIRFDCNSGGGTFTIEPRKLSFGPLISTRMACPADSLDEPFMRDLQRVVSFFLESGHLFLELPYDSGTMKFRLAP